MGSFLSLGAALVASVFVFPVSFGVISGHGDKSAQLVIVDAREASKPRNICVVQVGDGTQRLERQRFRFDQDDLVFGYDAPNLKVDFDLFAGLYFRHQNAHRFGVGAVGPIGRKDVNTEIGYFGGGLANIRNPNLTVQPLAYRNSSQVNASHSQPGSMGGDKFIPSKPYALLGQVGLAIACDPQSSGEESDSKSGQKIEKPVVPVDQLQRADVFDFESAGEWELSILGCFVGTYLLYAIIELWREFCFCRKKRRIKQKQPRD